MVYEEIVRRRLYPSVGRTVRHVLFLRMRKWPRDRKAGKVIDCRYLCCSDHESTKEGSNRQISHMPAFWHDFE